MPPWLTIAFLLAGALWLYLALASALALRITPALPPLPAPPPDLPHPAHVPGVSIVLAARDEGPRLAQTVRRLLAQRGVDLEVIAVDDRSADGTPELLRALAATDRRLTPLRVDVLPERWLGKCHALHLGAAKATREWILFVDADSWLAPDVAARAAAHAARTGADHVCLLPGFAKTTFWGRATLLLASLAFLVEGGGVNRDRAGAYVGVGAFNLVRAAAYRAAGGHERLRLEVVDDLRLGMLIRAGGGRTRAALGCAPSALDPGVREVENEWVSSALGFIRLTEKNYFAIMGFSLLKTAGAIVVVGAAWLLALAGPATGSWAGWAAFAGLASTCLTAWAFARRHRWSAWAALAAPLTAPVLLAAAANSAARTLARGGVRWRDTLYPLPMLREALRDLQRGVRAPRSR